MLSIDVVECCLEGIVEVLWCEGDDWGGWAGVGVESIMDMGQHVG